MSILLTGGAGFIGSHTAVELINAGYDTVIADNFSNSSHAVAGRIRDITGREVKVYDTDVSDEKALSRVFEECDIDTVIHFAGYKAVGESVKNPLMYYRNNIDSMLSVLSAMNRYKVHNLIFSSSATVYGVPESLPLTEDMPTGNLTNPYGWTKYMIEQIIKDYSAADPEFSAVLLRYFNPIGAHPSGLIGEDPDGIPNNLMPYITQVAAGRREYLSVYGNDYNTHDGTGVRDYIHVTDLALGHVAAALYCAEHKGAEEINLGTGKGYSVLDIVKTFEKVNDIEIPYIITERRAGDVDALYAGTEKAERLLGWKAQKDIADMCRDSWNWQKNNPGGYEED